MATLILIRHGQSLWNALNDDVPVAFVPLGGDSLEDARKRVVAYFDSRIFTASRAITFRSQPTITL
jgi:bisphosphoglycerate-dependent phosphoglycerate mutase